MSNRAVARVALMLFAFCVVGHASSEDMGRQWQRFEPRFPHRLPADTSVQEIHKLFPHGYADYAVHVGDAQVKAAKVRIFDQDSEELVVLVAVREHWYDYFTPGILIYSRREQDEDYALTLVWTLEDNTSEFGDAVWDQDLNSNSRNELILTTMGVSSTNVLIYSFDRGPDGSYAPRELFRGSLRVDAELPRLKECCFLDINGDGTVEILDPRTTLRWYDIDRGNQPLGEIGEHLYFVRIFKWDGESGRYEEFFKMPDYELEGRLSLANLVSGPGAEELLGVWGPEKTVDSEGVIRETYVVPNRGPYKRFFVERDLEDEEKAKVVFRQLQEGEWNRWTFGRVVEEFTAFY